MRCAALDFEKSRKPDPTSLPHERTKIQHSSLRLLCYGRKKCRKDDDIGTESPGLNEVVVAGVSSLGMLVMMSPRPLALDVCPSAALIRLGSISSNLVNIERSGRKCAEAPLSMIDPHAGHRSACAISA
jgi:hypothetical protein